MINCKVSDKTCMTLDDIKSLKLKVRKDADRSDLDPAHQTMIRQWNKLDSALYDHFLKVHNQMVDQYGREKMAADLKQLEGSLFFHYLVVGGTKGLNMNGVCPEHQTLLNLVPYGVIVLSG